MTFIRRPKATILLAAALFLVGATSYAFLPIAPLPQMDFPTIQVTANLPGANAQTMATSVAAPLERNFNGLIGLTDLFSTNSLGRTSVTLEFDLNRDINGAAQDVQAAIAAAAGNLPREMRDPPTYEKTNPAEATILSLAVSSDVMTIGEVDAYADTYVVQKLTEIDGVGLVDLNGEQKPAIRIRIDPTAAAARNIGLEEIRGAIAQLTLSAPRGSLSGSNRTIGLGANDQLFNAAAFNDLTIAYRGGSPIRLADIGEAIDGVEDINRAGWANGRRAVIVDVHKQPGANVNEIVGRIRAALPEILARLPPALNVAVVADRTQTIKAAVRDVQVTLLMTVAIVVLVVAAFLRRTWATAITGIVVPLSLFGTCAVMYALHFSLNNISLMALTIAVGFVIDDAIVMVENIVRHVEAGEPPLRAAVRGSRQVGFTIVSMTISLIAVFIPVLFMGGIVGRMFREFGITVCAAVGLSALISLTLTPALCALQKANATQAPRDGTFAALSDRLSDAYVALLDFALRHQRTTLGVMLATAALSVVCYALMPAGFFPEQDTGVVVGTTATSQDISSAAMATRMVALMDIVRRDPDVADVYGWIGPNQGLSQGRIMIGLKPFKERSARANEIMRRIRRQTALLPDVALRLQSRQDLRVSGRTGKNQYQYVVQDADIDELYVWSGKLLAGMKQLDALEDPEGDVQRTSQEVTVEVDRARAARLGVTPQAVDAALYNAFGQRQIATIYTQIDQRRVVLEAAPSRPLDAALLETLYVPSASGRHVPLSEVAELRRTTSTLSIDRQAQFPALTISFGLAPGVALGNAVAAIQRMEAELHLPPGVATGFRGTARAFQGSRASEPWLILAAVITVYVVLGVLYESYIHPITILSTLPSAGLGALLGLLLTGHEFDNLGLIGILLLIGIVKKNAIMMIDFALDAERRDGMAPEAAIRTAAIRRFRPIMMTTLAALLGALPLALAQGAGAELRVPLGVAVVFGLLLSQVLTLFTTPVVYLWLGRAAAWQRGPGPDPVVAAPG
jgi:multidrug efflux pump